MLVRVLTMYAHAKGAGLASLALHVLAFHGGGAAAVPAYEERYYNQTLDHFRFTKPRARYSTTSRMV